MHKVMDDVYSESKKTGFVITSDRIIKEIGKNLSQKE